MSNSIAIAEAEDERLQEEEQLKKYKHARSTHYHKQEHRGRLQHLKL